MANNISDYKLKRRNINDLIPAYLQTDSNISINENLFNRFLTKDEFNHVYGIVGSADPLDSSIVPIPEPTEYRQKNQLQPVAYAKVGSVNHFMSFEDFMERLNTLGVDTSRYQEWGNSTQFNWAPPIDFDKIVNFQDYYWTTSTQFPTPNYVVIKNLTTWSRARALQAKKTLFQFQTTYQIADVDFVAKTIVLPGNVVTKFRANDYVIVSDNSGNYDAFLMNSVTYVPALDATKIVTTAFNSQLTPNHKHVIGTNVPIAGVDVVNRKVKVSGNMTSLFVHNYIFSTKSSLSSAGAVFSQANIHNIYTVDSSSYDVGTNTTTISVQEPTLNPGTLGIDLAPLIFLLEGEYSKAAGLVNIKKNLQYWNIGSIAKLVWSNETYLTNNDNVGGITIFNQPNLIDYSYNFVSHGIIPGDYAVIKTGPNRGKFQISNVYTDNVGFYTSFPTMFDSYCTYALARNFSYLDYYSTTAPTSPVVNQIWIDTVHDSVNQWSGTEWITTLTNWTSILRATHGRELLENVGDTDWTTQNKWTHKDQIVDFSDKVRAALPIIEYSPYVELSSTSFAHKIWKYRPNNIAFYNPVDIQPTIFELLDIRLDSSGNGFQFDSTSSILFDQKYGNLTKYLVDGYKIVLSGFAGNNGIYEVSSSEYFQLTPNSRWITRAYLKSVIQDPFDLPPDATISPLVTAMGDTWVNPTVHWQLENVEVLPSSIVPTINPMLNSYLSSDNGSSLGLPFSSHVGLNWEMFNQNTDSGYNLIFLFAANLHDLVLYDDYQEGDIRVYLNGVRQYGNFKDLKSTVNSDFVGGIQFINTLITPNDTVRVELGEYAEEDIGTRAVALPIFTRSGADAPDFNTGDTNLFNLVNYRNINQAISQLNQYPYFRIFDIDGSAKDFSTNIFIYKEDSSQPINVSVLKRVVYDPIKRDYTFTQELSDPVTNELYCYKDRSLTDDQQLQTIWKVGTNIEQFVPSMIGNEWDVPNQFYYNAHHENYTDIKLTELFKHFRGIVNAQTLEGIIVTNGKSYYLDDDINVGLAGTIKEHNDGFDLLLASLFVNNVNPITLMHFAQEQYLFQLRFLQDQFSKNVIDLLVSDFNGISDINDNIQSVILNIFEGDEKFDQWFGDSTTYDLVTKLGVKNWVATLPFLGLLPKTKPYYIFDPDLNIYEVIHHDGHRFRYEITPALREYIFKAIINKTTSVSQTVTYPTDAFPATIGGHPVSTGDYVLRTITSTKERKLFRFSGMALWEEIDLNYLLVNVILNVETKLFNKLSDDTLPENFKYKFDFPEIKTDIAYDDLLRQQFAQYVKDNNIQNPFLLSNKFSQNDAFTWNYFYSPIPNHPLTGVTSYDTAGCWQALYEKVYQTPYPHLEPWKIQGYINMPDWWNDQYANTNPLLGRRWVGSMWNNILFGIVPPGRNTPDGVPGTGAPYQLPLTYQYLSVNIDSAPTADGIEPDGLLPPYWNTFNTSNPYVRSLYDPNIQQFVTLPSADFEYGQMGTTEWEWTISSQRLYDELAVAFKIQPLRFTNQTFDADFTIINCLQIDTATKKVYSHKDTIFHGDYVSEDVPIYYSNGLNQWYVHYNRYMGFDGLSSEFRTMWKEWDNPLSYVLGAFIDTASLSVYNQNFDVTEKDFQINVKRTYGIENHWLDALYATMQSVPSKYSHLRDNGAGWTVQFTTASPIARNIEYYRPQNYNFSMKGGNDTFRLYSYDLKNASITEPHGYQIVNYNQKINLTSPTGFANTNFIYYATIAIDSLYTINVQIRGYKAQTFNDFIKELNKQLGTYATAEVDLGNIKITSNSITANSAVVITDMGLFSTSSTFYSSILAPAVSTYAFNKFFEIDGNFTSVFKAKDSIVITGSTNYNGTYTLKTVVYDIDNMVTRLFVNEDVAISSSIIDGTLEPTVSVTLPPEWVTGTEVFLNTNGFLPTNFDTDIPFYVIRLNDREFKLAENPGAANIGIAVTPNASAKGATFVGKLNSTFKALGGANTSYTWRKHVVDKRKLVSASQPLVISGLQEVVDFVNGYDLYNEDIGFSCKSPNAENNDPTTGRINDWQYALENFIDWSYKLRSINQEDNLRFEVSFDSPSSTVSLKNNAVANWQNGQKITLIAGPNSELPEPFNNPYTQFVQYYVVRNYETNTSFKVANSLLDAQNGRFVEFTGSGTGKLYVERYNTEALLPFFELNPFKNYIWIEHPQGVLADVFDGSRLDLITNQRVYNKNGDSLTPQDLLVLRQDKETRISLNLNLVDAVNNDFLKIDDTYMAGMHVFLDGYEHIIPFSHYSIDDVLIYDTFLGLQTPRFIMEFNRQDTFNLRPNVGGFVLSDDDLIQNIESQTTDMRRYYDAYRTIEMRPTTKKIREALGYDGPKDYMDDLRINPKSQFIFWRGMIQNKGTNFAIDAFTNQTKFEDAFVDEFWAYKLAEFGDAKERNWIELKLFPRDSTRKEMRLEFDLPDTTAFDTSFESVKLTDMSRWWNQPDQLQAMPEHVSFYFNAQVTSKRALIESDVIFINGDWYYKMPKAADNVVITYIDTSGKTQTLVNLNDYEMSNSRLIRFISRSGTYTPPPPPVNEIGGETEGGDTDGPPDLFSLSFNSSSGSGKTSSSIPTGGTSKSTGDSGFKTTDGTSKSDGTQGTQADDIIIITPSPVDVLDSLTVYTVSYNYDAHNPARLIDKKAGVVVTNVPLWNPALGQYYYNAATVVDITTSNDPAQYSNRLAGNTTTAPWTDDRIGTVWFNNRDEGYIPYYDKQLYPDINDRIYLWGTQADYSNVELFEWTESIVPPDQWLTAVAADAADSTISSDNKRTGTPLIVLNRASVEPIGVDPLWTELTNIHFEEIAGFILPSTTPFIGIVDIYLNGKYDMTLNLDNYSLFDYVTNGVIVPGQETKPNFNDFIHVIKKAPAVETSDPGYGVTYLYATPYTEVVKFNKNTNEKYSLYYFWVKNKTNKKILPEGSISMLEAQAQITQMPLPYMILQGYRNSDFGYGLIYGSVFDEDGYILPLRYTQLIVKHLDGVVSDENRYVLRFVRDFTLRDHMVKKGDYTRRPLVMKNKHEEWKVFRQKQTQRIDLRLWEKAVEALIGYNLDRNDDIDYTKPIPSLNRVLYDNLYNGQTQFGFDVGQIFFNTEMGLNTLINVLSDPTIDYGYIDINQFMLDHSFDTPENIYIALNDIYNNFAASNINKIFFELMLDSFTTKYENRDIFKTSWVALEIAKNVTTPHNLPDIETVLVPDGICGVQMPPTATPIFVPSPTPTPFPTATPSPTPSATPHATPSHTPTRSPTASNTPSVTPTLTPTMTPTFTPDPTPSNTPTPSHTPSPTPTPSNTPSQTPTQTATPSVTPTNTPSISVTPTLTPTISVTPTIPVTPSVTMTLTPTFTPSPTITQTPTLTQTPTVTLTPTLTQTITPTIPASPSVTPTNTPTFTPTIPSP